MLGAPTWAISVRALVGDIGGWSEDQPLSGRRVVAHAANSLAENWKISLARADCTDEFVGGTHGRAHLTSTVNLRADEGARHGHRVKSIGRTVVALAYRRVRRNIGPAGAGAVPQTGVRYDLAAGAFSECAVGDARLTLRRSAPSTARGAGLKRCLIVERLAPDAAAREKSVCDLRWI